MLSYQNQRRVAKMFSVAPRRLYGDLIDAVLITRGVLGIDLEVKFSLRDPKHTLRHLLKLTKRVIGHTIGIPPAVKCDTCG